MSKRGPEASKVTRLLSSRCETEMAHRVCYGYKRLLALLDPATCAFLTYGFLPNCNFLKSHLVQLSACAAIYHL